MLLLRETIAAQASEDVMLSPPLSGSDRGGFRLPYPSLGDTIMPALVSVEAPDPLAN